MVNQLAEFGSALQVAQFGTGLEEALFQTTLTSEDNMSTNYGSSGDGVESSTSEIVGGDFTLSPGNSRTFFTVPALAGNESLYLQIKDTGSSTYRGVGTLVDSGKQVGTVTAQGAGSSVFRVIKRKTAVSTQMAYD